MRARWYAVSIISMLLFALWVSSGTVVATPSVSITAVKCADNMSPLGVGVEDFLAISADWNKLVFNPLNDLDGDGDVDIIDLVKAAIQFGSTCTPTTIFGVALGEGSVDRETKVRQAGAEWYRIIISWSQIEPAPVSDGHSYIWSGYDSLISGLRQRGLHPLVEIRGVPNWALAVGQPSCGLMSSTGKQAYSAFMTAMVERSDGDGNGDISGSPVVRYWEIGNEPDKKTSATHFGLCYGDHPEEYVDLLASSWDAIKGADPEGKVVFGGLAYENCCEFNSDPQDQVPGPDFFDSVLQHIETNKAVRDPKTHFDIVNIHAYQWFLANRGYTPPDVRTKYQIVFNKLTTFCPSCGLVPVMNTESGRRSDVKIFEATPTLEHQARYVPVLFARSLAFTALEVKAVFWFSTANFSGLGYGLLNEDNTSKPAYWAYKAFTEALAGGYTYDAPLTGTLVFPSPVEGHAFSNDVGDVIWVLFVPPQNEGSTQSVSFPFSKIKVVDYDKFNSTFPDGDGDPSKTQILCGGGSVNVSVTVDPITVHINPPESCP